MAGVIIARITTDALKFLPQMWGGLIPREEPITFKIGEGGWIDTGAGKVPRIPDPDLRRLAGPTDASGSFLQDLDAIVDVDRGVVSQPQRYGTEERFVFEKTFVTSDISFQAPSTLRLRCFLDLGEANDDGFTNDPEFWEIGIFTDHPDNPGVDKLMIAYGTFPQEIKDASVRLENLVLITMSNS